MVSPAITVVSPYTLIPAKLGSDCAASGGTLFSAWDVRHTYYGPSNGFLFDNSSSTTLTFYGWEHYGTYLVEPSLSFDADYNEQTQNTRGYNVKSGSRIYISSTRAGSYVTMNVTATYFRPSTEGFSLWSGDKI